MAKTNLKSDWDSSGNLVFTANASGSGSMVFNTGTPVVLGTQDYQVITNTAIQSTANYTMNATQLLTGFTFDNISGGNWNCALPTVASVTNVIPGFLNGTSFTHTYYAKTSAATQSMNVQADASSQWTLQGNCIVSSNYAKTFLFIVTSANTGNVIPTAVYSIAT